MKYIDEIMLLADKSQEIYLQKIYSVICITKDIPI